MVPACSPDEQRTIWRPEQPDIERYNNGSGGDVQVTDEWSVRLINDRNWSTIDISVYVIGTPNTDPDRPDWIEFSIETMIDYQVWEDADRTKEGLADIQYEDGALAYDEPDYCFEHAAYAVAVGYKSTAHRDFYWDGESWPAG